MKTEKAFTKKPFAFRSFRLPDVEAQLWREAAAKLGISQSEFLRRSLHEKTQRVLIDGEQA